MASHQPIPCRPPAVLAGAGAIVIGSALLLIAAAPLTTDDLWWHLKAGEMYATEGPWPAADWMLHTASPDAPVQHEWLFGVLVHAAQRGLGFHGLRALHALAVLGIMALFARLAWTVRRDPVVVAAAVVAFAALAAPRLTQLRPDLVTIAATLGIGLMLSREVPPGAAARAGLAVLVVLWTNCHSLVLIGINLIVAALLGVALHGAIAGRTGASPQPPPAGGRRYDLAWGRALAASLLVALVLASINPRGPAHLTTFITSATETAIWHIRDEWAPFRPWAWRSGNPTVSGLQWVVANAVIASFALTAVGLGWRLWRTRSRADLDRLDPIGLGLGLAGVAAMLVSIRFLWMGFLPLLYVLPRLGPIGRAALGRWGLAAAAGVGSLAFLSGHLMADVAVRFRHEPAAYVSMPYRHHRYFSEGVWFLRRSGIEGRLFNTYWMGGFLGYWLAPAVRTFIDGRTEHYPLSTYLDYSSVVQMKGARPGESYLDVLDRTAVDVFFGVGFPGWWYGTNTTTHLEGVPGWILVSRSFRHAIYLRDTAAMAANLERVAAYYRRAGIPFDPARGLEVERIIATRPDWAIEHALLPEDFHALLAAVSDPASASYHDARHRLALVYALNGAYRLQTDLDRRSVAAGATDVATRERLAYGLVKLGREEDAMEVAHAIDALGEAHRATARRLLGLAREHRAIRSLDVRSSQERDRHVLLNRLMVPAFPARPADTWALEYRMRTEPAGDSVPAL